MTKQPDQQLYEWECPECEYSSSEAKQLATENQIYCGMCAGDNGRDVRITKWKQGEKKP